MKKIYLTILIIILLFININVNAEEIDKISIENVAIPNVGEKFSDYLIRAKKEHWLYSEKIQISDFTISKAEKDTTRGIISCTKIENTPIEYTRGQLGQGFTSTALTNDDIFEEGERYSCSIGLIPSTDNTISDSLVGNNESNDISINKNDKVLINKIKSKLYKYQIIGSVYNITFDFKPGYTVSFVTNTDTELYDVSILPNEKIEIPTNLTKNNYEIEGWYTDENFVTKWNFGTNTVTKDITLYAKWKEIELEQIQEINPDTNDNILLYLTITTISLISLISYITYLKRKND